MLLDGGVAEWMGQSAYSYKMGKNPQLMAIGFGQKKTRRAGDQADTRRDGHEGGSARRQSGCCGGDLNYGNPAVVIKGQGSVRGSIFGANT